MALFSRKKSGERTRPASRTSPPGQEEAAELRIRARRRLVGALALVLAAVLIVPQIFDEPDVPEQTPVVLPTPIPPVSEPDLALAPSASGGAIGTASQGDVDDGSLSDPSDPAWSVDSAGALPAPGSADTSDAQGASAPSESATQAARDRDGAEGGASAPSQSTREPDNAGSDRAERTPAAPETPPASRSDSKPAPDPRRTDDGSVALALLEGRTPPSGGSSQSSASAPAQAPQKGNFILQIAAYSTEADAQARRARLSEAGVTNAYVEKTVSGNKTAYRLRVGSFPTRDAAQAAQARLRALGYDNSLLLSQ